MILSFVFIGILLSFIFYKAFESRKYSQSVADFLVANRSAGRYLLTICDGVIGWGAITIIMTWEIHYEAGFSFLWWDIMRVMVFGTILSLSGWCIYRFRQTRCMTLAEFFERRYSKRFRIFAGILAWFSGIVNFGIFPAVGAKFFIYYLQLPDTYLVYACTMFILLFVSLYIAFSGQIAIMITDFYQGVFANICFVVLFIFIMFFAFKWNRISEVLALAPDKINPFRVATQENFDITFYLIFAFLPIYGYLSWQGGQGWNSAALNPHELRMGRILSNWRILIQNLCVIMLGICAYVFMNHPDFAAGAENVTTSLSGITDKVLQNQARPTLALFNFLPPVLAALFAAVMLVAFVSNHDSYLLSWGSIFIQDVVLPLRKKPLSPEAHIKLLKWSMIGVAAFIFMFSLFYRQSEHIIFFFQVTGAIFLGGAGSAVIGGLYWKRGTTAGAWGGLVTGSLFSVTCLVLQQIHKISPFSNSLLEYIGSRRGVVMAFWASLAAIIVYVILSLLENKKFELDKLLHRKNYAIKDDTVMPDKKIVKNWQMLIGINSDFSLRDKIIYILMTLWTVMWIVIFLAVTAYHLIFKTTDKFWLGFWKFYIYVFFVLGTIVTIWFTIGGIRDIRRMYARLKTVIRDHTDNGIVREESNQQNKSQSQIPVTQLEE